MKAIAIICVLLLCACSPEHVVQPPALRTALPDAHHEFAPPGCAITTDGKYYWVQVGDYSMAPYALYDTRQGAIDCAWLCYRPDAK